MKTRYLLVAALLAALLGAWASRGMDGSWLTRTRAGQTLLRGHPRPGAAPVAGDGDPVPDLILADRRGRPTRLASYLAGRPTLINFWASWCGPCIQEMPALDAFAARQGGSGMQVIGIALDSADAVDAFLTAHPVRYPVLLDTPGPKDASVRLGDVRGVLPYSVLVDRRGRVLRQWVGPLRPEDLDGLARDPAINPTHD